MKDESDAINKYSSSMIKIPHQWFKILPLLALVFLMVSLMGDQRSTRAPSPESTRTDSHSGHNHKADAVSTPAEGSKGMNHSAEGSQGMEPDPVKQRRMGIHHFNEGNRFLGQGQYDQAIHNYEMALNHDPDIHEVYINLSTVYLKLKNYQRASQTLATLRAKNPDLPSLHYNLACYYSLTQQTDLSLEALKKALDLGYSRIEDIKTDPDLTQVRQTPGYREWSKTF